MKYLFIAFFIGLVSLQINSQSVPNEIVETFFLDYKEKGSSIALDNMYKSNEWIDVNGSAMINLKEKLASLDDDFVGKFNGYELIVEKRLADSYILKSYIVKFDRQPIRFTFQFYKPNDIWKIQKFKYDGEIDSELEEAAKLYYFRLN